MAEATAQQPGAADATLRAAVEQDSAGQHAVAAARHRKAELHRADRSRASIPTSAPIPGHWRRMYGALYVVEDLDAYLENPESYLAAHPLEIKDALLKDRRPRTEWKFDDLAGGGRPSSKAGRSYGNGKQIFHGGQLRRLPQDGRRRQRRSGPT